MPSYIAIFKQFYIVTSGYGAAGYLSSTEILKETESWWQTAANMAHGYMPRHGLRGISLPNGQFFVTGNGFYATMHYLNMYLCTIYETSLQVATHQIAKPSLIYRFTFLKQTSGEGLVRLPMPATTMR